MELEQLFRSTIESRALRKFIARTLTKHNLTYNEFEILYLMRDKVKLQPTQISNKLLQDIGTVSRTLVLLYQKNLISYTYDSKDRRHVFVEITKNGEQLLYNFVNSVN